MHSHGFATVEDPHGRWWRYARAHRWIRGGTDDVETGRGAHVCVEWHVDSWREWREFPDLVSAKVSLTGEETVDLALGLGPADLYLSLDVDRPVWGKYSRLARLEWAHERIETGPPGEIPSVAAIEHDESCPECAGTGQARHGQHLTIPLPIRFTISVSLSGVRWCIGPDDHSWSRNASLRERLRKNDLKWFRGGFERTSDKVVATVEETVRLPEGDYPVVIDLHREEWRWRIGPYSPSRRSRRRWSVHVPGPRRVTWAYDAKPVADGGLPVPGKGENSWDCGPDAIFGQYGRLDRTPFDEHDRRWVAEVIGSLTQSVLDTRVRYGRGTADTGA